ncbi:MAG: hypothetical protein ACPG3X_07395, partial [Opitutales bacterium]
LRPGRESASGIGPIDALSAPQRLRANIRVIVAFPPSVFAPSGYAGHGPPGANKLFESWQNGWRGRDGLRDNR